MVCCSVNAAGAHLARRLPYEHRPGRLVETVRELVALGGRPGPGGRGRNRRAGRGPVARRQAPGSSRGERGRCRPVRHRPVRWARRRRQRSGPGSGGPARRPPRDHHGHGWGGPAGPGRPTRVPGRRRRGVGDEPMAGRSSPCGAAAPGFEAWPLPPGLVGRTPAPIAAGASPCRTWLETPSPLRSSCGQPRWCSASGPAPAPTPTLYRTSAPGALAGAGVARGAVAAVATLDRKAGEPAIVALGRRLGVAAARPSTPPPSPPSSVPNPSRVVAGAVGTPSVAEAAALLAAGPGASLLTAKQVSATGDSTVAVARRARPVGVAVGRRARPG